MSTKAINQQKQTVPAADEQSAPAPWGNASADGQPAKAWLEFRCASPEKVEREYKGITLHFDELLGDDGKKKKN